MEAILGFHWESVYLIEVGKQVSCGAVGKTEGYSHIFRV